VDLSAWLGPLNSPGRAPRVPERLCFDLMSRPVVLHRRAAGTCNERHFVKAVIQWVPAPLSVKVRDARIYPAANCRCAGSCDGCHGWQLGRDAQLAAVIALTIVLSAVVALRVAARVGILDQRITILRIDEDHIDALFLEPRERRLQAVPEAVNCNVTQCVATRTAKVLAIGSSSTVGVGAFR
jgi:hypothetical protein